jgi:hypothetical protein
MSNLTDSYLNEENKLDGLNYINWKFKMHNFVGRIQCMGNCEWN